MIKSKYDAQKPLTQKVFMDSLIDFWEHIAYPMIENKADKIDVTNQIVALGNDIAIVKSDVKDIKRRVIDIEADTPTRVEFKHLKDRVSRLEQQAVN